MINKKLFFYRLSTAIFVGLFVSIFCYFHFYAYGAPQTADYILGTLPTDSDSITKLSQFDVLIMSPEQAIVRRSVIDQIRHLNPKIIMLAYVPSESYNDAWKEYPSNALYKDFVMNDGWYLRDTSGRQISDWPRLHNTDMSHEWSDYMVGFVQDKILSSGVWDGVFWDMMYDGIANVNKGDIDLNRDGIKDDPTTLNAEWIKRMEYLLSESQRRLPVKYIMMNGTSINSLQKYVNGRMYENFPTPWEAGGSWSGIMTGLKKNQSLSPKPQIYVFNANTANTGNQNDFRRMRFGLASSLMVDNVYFSFDFGDKDHNQVWRYDEYDVKLGDPAGSAISQSGGAQFNNSDVWRREYVNGVALVNPTAETRTVDLGDDYEKIIGKQDPGVNDGSIVSKVDLNSSDGLILRKVAQNLFNTPFKNGSLVRFYDARGQRARNGFFAFVPGVTGGARVFVGDLDGVGDNEKVVGSNGRLEIFNVDNLHWFDSYPFGGDNNKELRYSVGKSSAGEVKILVTPTVGNRGILYDYHGTVLKEDFLPFGPKYNAGFYGALGNFGGGSELEAAIGSGGSRVGEVLIYDGGLQKIKYRFFPFDKKYLGRIKVAAGDINGDGKDEIITMGKFGLKNVIRIFDSAGKKLSEFSVTSQFGNADLNIGATDVNFDGKDEVVVDGG